MRLINARNLQPYSFDNDAERPKYAILSHRWVNNEEVTLHELSAGLNKLKSGWRKIDFCCKEALKHDLEWVWVDTCCIDKTSSAELSEAINSMYQWYRSAYVCFAYISDAYEESEESFRNSVWFKRSWTLQELLAPDNVRFYNTSFDFMGTKREMVDILESITNVPKEVLNDPENMYMWPVATRMSWAATRDATRVEDIAYSLFGIFKVNLPLLYGEGTRAFTRLQEEIVRQSDDQSIFVWDSPGHGYCPCFAASPADFRYSGWLRPVSTESPNKNLQEKARPYALTNVGLHMDCKVIQYTSAILLAFLPWASKDNHRDNSGQYCFFLSQSRGRSNLWHRIRLRNRAYCTLREAIIMACLDSFIPCQTGQDSIIGTENQDFQQLLDRYPFMERAFDALSDAYWKDIYIELYPRIGAFDFEDRPSSLVLDIPSLSSAVDATTRPFALVGNFDWTSPGTLDHSSNSESTICFPANCLEKFIVQRDFDLVKSRRMSKLAPMVSYGGFTMYPPKPGLMGALLFERPRLGLKALLVGLNEDLKLTLIAITHEADVDISPLYKHCFPTSTLVHFKSELLNWEYNHWLTDVLRYAFEGHARSSLPKDILIQHEGDTTGEIRFPLGGGSWWLEVTKEGLSPSGPYWKCLVEMVDDKWPHGFQIFQPTCERG